MSDPSLLVLSSLAEGDKHGYLIMQDVEAFAQVRLGPGTLYGAITRLEERGWIQPVGPKDRRQTYTITPAGRDYLKEQLSALQNVARTGLARLRHA
jgi:DNA-binding PadR family transcriptional regulator